MLTRHLFAIKPPRQQIRQVVVREVDERRARDRRLLRAHTRESRNRAAEVDSAGVPVASRDLSRTTS